MKRSSQKKYPTAMLIDKDTDNLHNVIESLMSRFNETIIVCPIAKNELPTKTIVDRCYLTVVEGVYDKNLRLKLQELSLRPIRYVTLNAPNPPEVPKQVPGVRHELGGSVQVIVEEKPKKKVPVVPTKAAPALRSTPITKKLTEDQLFDFLVQQHNLYEKDLYGKLLAPTLIIVYYKIQFPSDLDIEHVAKQIDTWARSHPRIRYNPIRKKFCPKPF